MFGKIIKLLGSLVLLICFPLLARDNNLVIFVDNLRQETCKTDEVNMTHQLITALQQRASLVLVSTSLWKNIIDRKKKFEKELEDVESLESNIFNMYQVTNQELKNARYNLNIVNQKLSHDWFGSHYSSLAELHQNRFNQLRFDFLCYIFQFDINRWHVYASQAGMLLFVPQELGYTIDSERLLDEKDLVKHADKKSNVEESLRALLSHDSNRWVIYFSGHGHPKSSKQGANIAGVKIDEFKKILEYCHEHMKLKLLVYSSCYGGGVHTVEPYAGLKLHYPVIVTAATDAPIFGFGLFEGVKLPPYDHDFKLLSTDVLKHHGLVLSPMQNYEAFFKRAWKGWFDLQLIQLISQFFICDLIACHIQKVENFPLIRKAYSDIFVPLRDHIIMKLVQQVTTNSSISSSKPLLLYAKKVKKIKIDRPVPIISMLPGMQSHEIHELIAPNVMLSSLLSESFLSMEDMQGYKNFMIKKLVCINDVSGNGKLENLTNVVLINQHNLMPRFVQKNSDQQALIYFYSGGVPYLFLWYDQKIQEEISLTSKEIQMMTELESFIAQAVKHDSTKEIQHLLTFDAYQENKDFQQDLVDGCIKIKVCKKG